MRTFASLASLSVGIAVLAAATPASAQPTCLTAECHVSLAAADRHPAAEDCSNCHEAVATPHPQSGVRTFRLSADPPELCLNCHDAFGGKAQTHEPVAAGDCTTCHDPHGTERPKLLVEALPALCQQCHDVPADVAHPHGPVAAGDCTSCHAPHESDNKPLLVQPGDKLCFQCHGDIASQLDKDDVHPAIDEGCVSCHQPHGSANDKLLAEPVPALCFECHDDIGSKVTDSPVVHAAAANGKACVNCHSPHATAEPKLLLKPEKETCLGCHGDIVQASMTTLHGPIAEGRCTPCHDPHGSTSPKLLVRSFPATEYVPYSDSEFALCFGCHNRDLLRYPDTSFATNFRDGERNLHYLHVNNPQKGRSCKLCHELHGASNSKLIADSVPFGSWRLPLKFVATATGGSCAPGCHQPQSYDRDRAGRPTTP